MADGTYHLYAADAAGNLSSASSNAVTVSSAPAATIDLGANGQLISPVSFGGNLYYVWDISKNGTQEPTSSDVVFDHNILDAIFYKDSGGFAQTPGLDTTDVYHFGTINGVNLSLPTTTELVALMGSSTPTGWLYGVYWSATQYATDQHGVVLSGDPTSSYFDDDISLGGGAYVALRVI